MKVPSEILRSCDTTAGKHTTTSPANRQFDLQVDAADQKSRNANPNFVKGQPKKDGAGCLVCRSGTQQQRFSAGNLARERSSCPRAPERACGWKTSCSCPFCRHDSACGSSCSGCATAAMVHSSITTACTSRRSPASAGAALGSDVPAARTMLLAASLRFVSVVTPACTEGESTVALAAVACAFG